MAAADMQRRNAENKQLAAQENAVMVKHFAPVRVSFFCLLATCGAFCQSEHAAAGAVQKVRHQPSSNPQLQQKQRVPSKSLPDAPSARLTEFQPAPKLEAHLALTIPMGGVSGNKAEQSFGAANPAPYDPASLLIEAPQPAQKDSNPFLSKYLYPSLVTRQNTRYQASSNDKFMGRATDAASKVFLTRDDSGRRRVNATYFMGVLTSVAMHAASRPYWARNNSASAPLSDFGSTVGSDAGMNLLHEFGPGIRQVVNNHMPTFVVRMQDRFTGQNAR